MTSVPPTNNDDPDETPQRADSPSTVSSAAGTSPADSGTSTGPKKTDQTWDADGSTSASTSGSADSSTSTPSAADPSDSSADSYAAGSDRVASSAPEATSAAEPAATPATAPGRSSHAAPRPVPSSAEDSSETSRLPTEEEDEALRAERERRFGRVAGPAATEEPSAEPTAQAAEPATEEPSAVDEPETTTMAPPPPPEEEPDPFADFDDGPTSRAAAHWWGILIAVVFGPVTWYLIADGGERVSYALSQNLDAINVLGLVELAGGLVTLIILLLAARWSSVGSIIIGSIGALIGAAFVAVPGIVDDFLSSQSVIFDRLGQFGTNVFDHLVADGHSGRLLAYGIAFIFIGVVSHGARRQGRREERRKIALGE